MKNGTNWHQYFYNMLLSDFDGSREAVEFIIYNLFDYKTQCPACMYKGEFYLCRKKSRYKCKCCRKEWSIRKNSIFDGFRIPWTRIISITNYCIEAYNSKFSGRKQHAVIENRSYNKTERKLKIIIFNCLKELK